MKTTALLRLLLGLCPLIFAQQHYFTGSAAGFNHTTGSGNAFVGHSTGSSTWVASGSKPAHDIATFADGLEVV